MALDSEGKTHASASEHYQMQVDCIHQFSTHRCCEGPGTTVNAAFCRLLAMKGQGSDMLLSSKELRLHRGDLFAPPYPPAATETSDLHFPACGSDVPSYLLAQSPTVRLLAQQQRCRGTPVKAGSGHLSRLTMASLDICTRLRAQQAPGNGMRWEA